MSFIRIIFYAKEAIAQPWSTGCEACSTNAARSTPRNITWESLSTETGPGNIYSSLDPCNQFNPGIGQTSKFACRNNGKPGWSIHIRNGGDDGLDQRENTSKA